MSLQPQQRDVLKAVKIMKMETSGLVLMVATPGEDIVCHSTITIIILHVPHSTTTSLICTALVEMDVLNRPRWLALQRPVSVFTHV